MSPFVYFVLAVGPLYLFVVFVLRYIVAPLRMRDRNSLSIEPRFQTFDLGQAPAEVLSNFREIASQLASMGFVALANLTQDRPSGLVTESFNLIWVNRQQGDIAQAIVCGIRRQDGSYHSGTTIAFRRQFTDGSELITTNTNSPTVFPRDPTINQIVVSGMLELVKLYEFHLARARRTTGSRQWYLPDEGQGLAYAQSVWAKNTSRLNKIGYRTPSLSDGKYRATLLKGTLLYYWRMKWPLKQINNYQRDRAADRELSSLGFTGLEFFRHSPGPFVDVPVIQLPVHAQSVKH